MAWKVPDQASASAPAAAAGCPAAPRSRRCAPRGASSRRRRGARRSAAGCGAGSTPLTTRCATRCASVLVLPEPAPAMTSSGPRMRIVRAAVLDGAPLLGIEPGEIGGGHRIGWANESVGTTVPVTRSSHNRAANPNANLGSKGHWTHTVDQSPFDSEVRSECAASGGEPRNPDTGRARLSSPPQPIYSGTRRRRRALPTTLTDDSAMAAAATIGDSRMPKRG